MKGVTLKKAGRYKLEVWGAQAGGLYSGYGGYSYGNYQTTANGVLYVVVGGQGTAQYGSYNVGGYNGGGYGSSVGRSDMNSGGGGGATHIATRTGLLSSLSSYQSSVLIVAGGGGGGGTNAANWQGYGGNGGGYQGTPGRYCAGNKCNNSNPQPVVGTQSSGYSFGLGGSATNSNSNCAGGGGGGWYGGGATTAVNCNNWGGSGGSGYIANSSLLSDKGMYMYNYTPIGGSGGCTASTAAATKTTCTNNAGAHVSNYANTGNGYAKITYLGT